MGLSPFAKAVKAKTKHKGYARARERAVFLSVPAGGMRTWLGAEKSYLQAEKFYLRGRIFLFGGRYIFLHNFHLAQTHRRAHLQR